MLSLIWRWEGYKGKKKVSGEVADLSPGRALRSLRKQGVVVSKVSPSLVLTRKKTGPSKKDLALIVEQFYIARESGIPLNLAVSTLPSMFSGKTKTFAKKLRYFVRDRGLPLSEAFSQAGAPPYVVALLKASESSGDPGKGLKIMTGVFKSLAHAEGMVGKMVVYPKILMVMLLWVSVFIFSFVLPRLKPLLDLAAQTARGWEVVPAPTRIAMSLGVWTKEHLAIVVVAVFVLSLVIVRVMTADRIFRLLSLGGVTRSALRDLELMKLAAFMSLFLETGLRTDVALKYLEDLLDTNKYSQLVSKTRIHLERGYVLSQSMKLAGFEEEVVGFVRNGENTNALSLYLTNYAGFKSANFYLHMERVVNAVPIFAMLIVGAFVVSIVAIVVAPLYDIAFRGF